MTAGSQLYIGAPNGVVVCVDRLSRDSFAGRMYHGYAADQLEFDNVDILIHGMHALFEYLDFPREGTNIREFEEEQGRRRSAAPDPGRMHEEIHIVREEASPSPAGQDAGETIGAVSMPQEHTEQFVRKDRKRIMSDKDLLEQHGYLETFIIRVQHRQNSTWQGRITWADEDKTLNFRSIWEMIHLMESALDKDASPEQLPEIHVWDETKE